jgi:hypothetical protein
LGFSVPAKRESARLIETLKSPAAVLNFATDTRRFIVAAQSGHRPLSVPSLAPSGQNSTSSNAGRFGDLQ